MNKKRRCRYCKEYKVAAFMKIIHSGAYCNLECATKYAYQNKDKGAKTKHTAQKKALKDNDKPFRLKQAQFAFNAFIRERDKDLGCVSCDKDKNWHGQWHCGHFKTVGARAELRFTETNAAKQCSQCNNYLSGNIIEYEKELIKRVGANTVRSLDIRTSKIFECDELKEIELLYKNKLKALKSE